MINKSHTLTLVICTIMFSTVLTGCNQDDEDLVTLPTPKVPTIYAHRGAAGYLPDHTLEGYKKGIELGADFVEPDLVMTKDGVLVCRHEPNIKDTTNVKDHPEFADRKTTKMVDGNEIKDDWFVSDFTLAELKTLRAIQPLPQDRTKEFDGKFLVPTFEEMIKVVQDENKRLGKTVGIIPEIKHSTYQAAIFGVNKVEDEVLRILAKNGYTKKDSPVIIQSFEISNLKYLNNKTDVRLVQLIDGGSNLDGSVNYVVPYDLVVKGITTEPALNTKEGLAAAAKYADIIGPWKNYIVGTKGTDTNGDGKADDITGDGLVDERDRTLLTPTDFIKNAHAAGLQVVPYTFRNEPRRLAKDYAGDPKAEYKKFFTLGVDGLFTDFVDTAVAARDGK